MVPIITMCFIF